MRVRHSVWLIPPRLTLGQSIYIHNWKDKKWNLIFGQIEHFSPEPHQLLTQRAKPITSGEKILEQVISGSTSRMTATTSNTPTSPSSSMVDTCSPQFPSILDYKDRYRPLPQVKLHIFWSERYPLDRAIYRRYMALAKFGNVFMCSMLHCITKIQRCQSLGKKSIYQGEMGRGKFGTVYHVVGRKSGISYASKHVKYRCKCK